MMTTDNKWRILKDVLFLLLAVVLIWKGRFLGILIGALAISWYGRDLYFRLKALKDSRAPKRDPVERPKEPSRDGNAPPIDDGKIQVTDLSGAKEVDFEKE